MGERQMFTEEDKQQLREAGDKLNTLGCRTGPAGVPTADKNSDRILDYFVTHGEIPLTVDNVLAFVKANHIQFFWEDDTDPFETDPVKKEYNELAKKFAPIDRDRIAGALNAYGYDTESNLLWNWNIVAKAFLQRQYPVTPEYLKLVMGNIGKQPHQELVQKGKRKFDPESVAREKGFRLDPEKGGWVRDKQPEDKRNPEEATTYTSEGHVKPYKPSQHALLKKEETVQTDPNFNFWKDYALRRLRDIRQTTLQQELQQTVIAQAEQDGNWRYAFNRINSIIETGRGSNK
jgi:hypothetical protein